MKLTTSTTIKKIDVQRFAVAASKPFEEVLATLQAAIGQPAMSAFGRDIASASTYKELESTYRNEQASNVAKDLDAKVEALLTAAAG